MPGTSGVSGYVSLTSLSPSAAVGPGAVNYSNLPCPVGKVPLGGGYELVGSAPLITFIASVPVGNSWGVLLRNDTAATVYGVQVRLWVLCATAL